MWGQTPPDLGQFGANNEAFELRVVTWVMSSVLLKVILLSDFFPATIAPIQSQTLDWSKHSFKLKLIILRII